jgi:hypothetical protein
MTKLISLAGIATLIVSAACASSGQRVDTQPEPAGPAQVASSIPGEVPVGQQLDVRLQDTLSSETATVEQRFMTTTAVDVMQGDRVLIPAGSTVRGVVRAVEKAGRVDRTGRLTLAFDQLNANGRTYPLTATATQIYRSEGIRGEGKTVGVGAAAGAIIGGIIDGLSGAVLGAIIGGGGVIAATEGNDVTLPAGSIIRLRFDSPVRVQQTTR